jgi:hypothetical protein
VRIATTSGTLLRFHPVDEADMPNHAGKPAGVTFPFGFFDWSIGLPAASATTDVTFTFPAAVPTPPQYWKPIVTGWINLCLHVLCSVNGNDLTLTLRDGDIGDLDGIGNAVIVDPGGLGSGGDSGDTTFGTCLLYDPGVAKKSGSTYPIKLRLCDAAGRNLSSPSIVLRATGITQTNTSAAGPLDDSGDANPDFDFRYDASFGGYIFNLKTTGLTTGTYNLHFTAGSDSIAHAAPFSVK